MHTRPGCTRFARCQRLATNKHISHYASGMPKKGRQAMMTMPRRTALQAIGLGLTACAAGAASPRRVSAKESEAANFAPRDARELQKLSDRLAEIPRHRDFKSVPMILTDPEQWDAEALKEVIAYKSPYKQVWDNTDLASPWLNLMRNSLNSQIWSFKHPDFLVVSATHGTAHLALFDPATWEKYQLAKLTGGKFQSNTLIEARTDAAADPNDYENVDGADLVARTTTMTQPPFNCRFLHDADGFWTSKVQHPVQDAGSDGNLGGLPAVR